MGSLTSFTPLAVEDSDSERNFRSIDTALQSIQIKEILAGNLIKNVVLATGVVNKISHGLQYAVSGWIVVKSNAQATLWDNESSNTQKEQLLFLRTSAAVTVTLWVF